MPHDSPPCQVSDQHPAPQQVCSLSRLLYVQEMKAGIDVHALEQDVEAGLRLQDLTQQLCCQEASLSR